DNMSKAKTKEKNENKTEKALAAEKEQFGKQQVRILFLYFFLFPTNLLKNIILGTHKETGATTFWSYAVNLPVSSNSMVSWKFCYLLHKVLRDGHRNSVVDSHRHSRTVRDMGVLWGNLHDRYGHIVALYTKYLHLKMEFHAKVKTSVLKDVCLQSFICKFELSFVRVLRQLDANGAKSTTPAGQCRLTPLIPLILDSSFLYHFSVFLRMFFSDIERGFETSVFVCSLTHFYKRAREMEFFKSVIQIPDLPDEPPNFLRAAALAEYKKPVVVMPGEDYQEEEVETHPEFREIPQMPQMPQVRLDMNKTKYYLSSRANSWSLWQQYYLHMEAELDAQRTHNQVAMIENEHLRMEVEALRAANVVGVGAQIGYKEADGKAQAAELRFSQLKERHAELVTSHADLMKKNAEAVRMLSSSKQEQDDLLRTKTNLEKELDNLRWDKQTKLAINAEQKQEIDRLRRELDSTRAELTRANSALVSNRRACSPQSGTQLNSTLAGLQAEKEVLLRSVREQEAELNSLRQQAHLQHSSLEQESSSPQACRETELAQKLQNEQFALLQCAVVEAEGIILDAVAKLDDPIHVRCTSSPDYLVNRAEVTLGSIDKLQQSHLVYLGNRSDASGLLRAVTQFSHLAADTIVNGAATSHSAPVDHADSLSDSCRDCANQCLQFLKDLKFQPTLPGVKGLPWRWILHHLCGSVLVQDLRPKGQDVLKEELGTMVDKEMVATSTAIEDAVLRMDEILSQARRDTTELCPSGLHILVTAATDLQKDIVEGGRGAASTTEFYAKNSRWTEGLISASKAVGWGATQLLDSADRVVSEKGTYEELIACSHEIAGSTAQLVAASKVKADRSNKKLNTLQQASRHVNDMAAVVVTSTKHGQKQISDHGLMDFSGMSLIKLKKEEMEAQVKVLQLENQLEQERIRLGELRKRHYDLGPSGPASNLKEEEDNFPPPPPPTLLDSTPLPPSFSQTQPYLNTQTPQVTQPYSHYYYYTLYLVIIHFFNVTI
uniref:Huntingtin interacting protein 1 related n=1 Tax=Oryzias melastigma TaxID=30732 RepID=A0A3B3CNV0_ORYME